MDKEIAKVTEVLKRTQLLDLSLEACERYGKLSRDLKSSGKQIGDLDTLIASIALTHNESILTANVDHFQRVSGLIVKRW